MTFTEYFINNRTVTYSLAIFMLITGVFSYTRLSVNALPKFHTTEIGVDTTYVGASADFMEKAVTTPLEQAMENIIAIDTVRSLSETNASHIHITLKPNIDVTQALSQIQNAVSLARAKLPTNINPPIVVNNNDADANAIMYLGAYGSLAPVLITEYIKTNILNGIEEIPGVGNAQIIGGKNYAARVWLDAQKLQKFGVTPDEVIDAINDRNQSTTGGVITDKAQAYTLQVSVRPGSLAELGSIVVKHYGNKQVVKVSDLGRIEFNADNLQDVSRVNGKPGIIIEIDPAEDADSIVVSEKVKSYIASVQSMLPKGLAFKTIIDQSTFIKQSVHQVYQATFEAILLVAIAIILFLGSIRLALIPLITIPMCVISICVFIYLAAYSINMMTLLAMVLSIGLVVDDAIVVVENIYRHFAGSLSPMESAIKGSGEIVFPIISMTTTLAVVYSPIFLIQGLTGDLVKPFASTLSMLVIISGLLSLTLTPMMCGQLLNHAMLNSKGMDRASEFFEKLKEKYLRLLSIVIAYKVWMLGGLALLVIIGIIIYGALKSELVPPDDYGIIYTGVDVPANASPDYMSNALKLVEDSYIHQSAIENFIAYTDFGDSNVTGIASLKPLEDRSKNASEISEKLSNAVMPPDIKPDSFSFSLLQSGDSDREIRMAVMTTRDYIFLNDVVSKLVSEVSKYPGVHHVRSDLNFNNQEYEVEINEELANDLGVPVSSIANALSVMYGEMQTDFGLNTNGVEYPIILSMPLNNKADLSALDKIWVKSDTTQKLIQLSRLVTIHDRAAPLNLSHFNGFRSALLKAQLTPGYGMGEVMGKINTLANHVLPADTQFSWTGSSRDYLQSTQNMKLIISLSLLAIYLVLTIQFKSFSDPLIILLTVPLSFIGAVFALRLTGGSINIYTQVGLLTLIGLIAKHGILITDFANMLRAQGNTIEQAIIKACAMRLRPILMTASAMILGAIPLAFLQGEGTASLKQIGWVIVGGLSFGTILSLFIVPIAYLYISQLRRFVGT